MQMNAEHVASATLEITVTRADGTVEHYGVVDSWEAPSTGWRALLARVINFFSRH